MNILQAEGIDTFYGRVQILHELDLAIREGKITAIIGPNGAGKSTALKALFGLVPTKAGRVLLRGEDVTGSKPADMVDRRVCFVPQGRAVFPSLSVSENLRMGAFREKDRGAILPRMEDVFERFPALRQRRTQKAGALSGGEQQMLAIGRGLMADPEILLLDEPSVGLAPRVVEEILTSLEALNAEGKTLVIVEQNATMALQTAHDAYLLVMGRARMAGPAADLLTDPEVKKIYLGA